MPATTRTRVLITVMTYPNVSLKNRETVCTAGITEQNEWVRLYPIDYRYQPSHHRFHKYQWIDVDLMPFGQSNDHRKESRKPILDSMSLAGEPMDTADNWRARREIIDKMPHHTLNELKARYDVDKTSLGIVRPSRVVDLVIEEAEREWDSEKMAIMSQMDLFGDKPNKPLAKLPYSFHYIFECEDSEKPHRAMCEDWELGVLFLREVERLGSEEKAAESVRKKFLDQLCHQKRDTRFFVGTYNPFNVWLVLGVFWPPRKLQGTLF